MFADCRLRIYRCCTFARRRIRRILRYPKRLRVAINRRLRAVKRWHSLGSRGERAVCRYLTRNNFFIWGTNIRSRQGEIDIVASQRRVLVFVEVKTRRIEVLPYYPALSAIDAAKRRRMHLLARRYVRDNRALLKRRRIKAIRFDVIEVAKRAGYWDFEVRQLAAAFE